MDRLTAQGLPIARPEVVEGGEPDYFVAEEMYNVHLARRMSGQDGETGWQGDQEDTERGAPRIVTNDVRLSGRRRIFVLTGPNQGGKTTFVQALGMAQVLAQVGLFVPARRARIRPVDQLLTHFPTAEQGAQDTGRFSEELARLSELLGHTTASSMVLLNESLSSTNPVEASSVAQEILRALRALGTRCVFATHLHELAYEIDAINEAAGAEADVGHLRAEVKESDESGPVQRTYRIVEGPPMGTSYARDIAERYGMSFERIIDGFRRRGLLE
jgi:DNA mismatch repair ATPase MutS